MIWSAAGPSLTARAVGGALAQFMRPDGTAFADPAQNAIGIRAGCSARTVRKALVELELNGWVGIARETFRGGDNGQAWRKNTYWLTLPKGAEDPSLPLPQGAEDPSSASAEGEEECSDEVRNILPDTTKSNNKTVYTSDFERLWELYPKKVGKIAADRVWKATVRRGTDTETLLRAASRYAAVCRSDGTAQKYIKNPATFFGRDEPWRDYTDEAEAEQRDRPYGGSLR